MGPNPAAAPPLRWGILAPGHVARAFARDVRAHTQSTIHAVGSRDAARAEAFATEFSIPRAYPSYAELLADTDVEAIYIASPHAFHFEHARAALDAGKHLLIEKAFTHNAHEAELILSQARALGLHVMEAMWTRFLPHFYGLRALLARRTIGDIVKIRASHGQPLTHLPRLTDPALAGGALLDLGVYPISFAHHILGRPLEIRASGLIAPSGVDSSVDIEMIFDGATASLAATMTARTRNTAEIIGTVGKIILSDPFFTPQATITVHLDGEQPYTLAAQVDGGLQFQAAEVARNVRAGVLESPLIRWQDTLEVMSSMDEVRRQIGLRFPRELRG